MCQELRKKQVGTYVKLGKRLLTVSYGRELHVKTFMYILVYIQNAEKNINLMMGIPAACLPKCLRCKLSRKLAQWFPSLQL